jgi:hypothetical protein
MRAAATCAAAFEREGWFCFMSAGAVPGALPDARTQVVIWTQASAGSVRLARENRAPLENGCLFQLLLQPERPRDHAPASRKNVIEPPEPFCFHQGLPVTPWDVNGTQRAIDAFAHSWSTGHTILREVARLGGLRRPSDSWNALIVFRRPFEGAVEPVVVSEYASVDSRLLRRDRIDGNGFVDTAYDTTVGNRWQLVTQRENRLVTEVSVVDGENYVQIPRKARWWQRSRSR